MNTDKMPAGREMDALIAERVMGWIVNVDVYVTEAKTLTEAWKSIPNFSTDENASGLLQNHIIKQGLCSRVVVYWGDYENQGIKAICSIARLLVDKVAAVADTRPLAVCRATLKVASEEWD